MKCLTAVVGLALAMFLMAVAPARAAAVQMKAGPIKKAWPIKAADAQADAKVTKILMTKKVSFDFVATPLQDAVAFLRQVIGVNMVLDPAVNGKQPLTLKVNDMNAGRALKWMAKVGGGELKVQNGAVYIAPVPKAKVRRMVYKAGQQRVYRRTIGRVDIKLGDVATVQLQLYEDDLPEESREMLLKLLHKALAKELAKLEKAKKQ